MIDDLLKSFEALASVSRDADEAADDLFVSFYPPEEYAVVACGVAESDIKNVLLSVDSDYLILLKNHRIINITRDHSYPRARSTTT